MMKITLNKIPAILCAVVLVLWYMAGAFMFASAEETAGSMTLWCVKEDDIVVNMHWQLYRVGHRENNDYVFEGDFENYRTTLGDQTKPMLEWDAETVTSVAESLKRKIIVDKIEKRDEGYTNNSGAVTFDGLENGLYLVWGDILIVGNTTYIPSAIFFEMNSEDINVVNAYPKIVLKTLSDSDSQYSVRKVWQNDEDQPWNRTVSITVERYRDNQYYDDIELSEDNDWTYEWEDKDGHTWFVYEKEIPDNYTASYKENHTQCLIINTYEGNDTTETTTTTPSTSSTVNTTTTTSSSTKTNSTEKAPQTGQLWWPVPALTVGGLLCFGTGLVLRKKNDEE